MDNLAILEQVADELDVLVASEADQLLFTLTLGDGRVPQQGEYLALDFQDLFGRLPLQILG